MSETATDIGVSGYGEPRREAVMEVSMIARVLWLRRILRRRERWSQTQLAEHQRRELAALRRFASARSPFYRQYYRHRPADTSG